MGLCLSSGAVGESATPRDTALVLLPTGELREYPRPATAARVLHDASSSASNDGGGWFLCDADRMGFEGPVAAVDAAEELRAGQIYFVLPAAVATRRCGLSREEVAALAVRASAALSRAAAAANGSGKGRRRRGGAVVAPLVFAPPPDEEVEPERTSSYKVAPQTQQPKRRPVARPGRRLQRFASDLTAIPECEMSSE